MADILTVPQPQAEGGCSKHHDDHELCFREPKKIQLSENKMGAAQVRNEHQLLQTIGKLNTEHRYELGKIQEDIINMRFRWRVINTDMQKRAMKKFQDDNPHRDATMDMDMINKSIKYIKVNNVYECAYKRLCGKKPEQQAGEPELCHELEKRLRERDKKRRELSDIHRINHLTSMSKPKGKPAKRLQAVKFKSREALSITSTTDDESSYIDTEDDDFDNDSQIADETVKRPYQVYQSRSAPQHTRGRGLIQQNNQSISVNPAEYKPMPPSSEKKDALAMPRSKTSLSKVSKMSIVSGLTVHEKLVEDSEHLKEKLDTFFNKMDISKAAAEEESNKSKINADWSFNMSRPSMDSRSMSSHGSSGISKVIYPMYMKRPKPQTPKVTLPTSLQHVDEREQRYIRGIPHHSAIRANKKTQKVTQQKVPKEKKKPKSVFF